MTPKTIRPALALSALLVAVAGCASTGGEVVPAKEPKGDVTTDAPQPEPTADTRPAFGDAWAFDDGLTVTIGEPEPFEPGEWAIYDEDAMAHLKFEVVVENSTGEDYDPNLIVITANSGGREAEPVFDAQNSLDGTPSTTVIDGSSVAYNVGFSVLDPESVHVEFRDFDMARPNVIFVR